MIESLYNIQFNTLTRTDTQDEIGANVVAYNISQSNIPGYLTYLEGSLEKYAGKAQVSCTHRLFCDANVVIDTTDRVQCLGDIYQCLYVNRTNKMTHHLEIELRLLKGDENG